jgi:WD repeat-containing protein 20
LLVGFTTGQIQLIYPGRREQGKLYNEERLIDKTKVTCLKWLPNSSNLFLAAHASGHLYLYNEELPCTPAAPIYQPFKCGEGFSILTCKSKSTRNPLYKWSFGIHCNAVNGNNSSSSSSSSSSTISSSSSSYSCASDNCSINEFCFSPDGTHLAIASQDGFLRIFQYENMELVGLARSYFGGFLCVCWSPDGKYVVVGGEDDLVTVYSFTDKRVVARGQGHRSWVSKVAFDPYTTFSSWDANDFSDDENQYELQSNNNSKRNRTSSIRDSTISAQDKMICYRLVSVSQDTQLCLWDITEDILRPHHRVRLSTHDPQQQSSKQQNETVQTVGDPNDTVSPAIGNKESNENTLNNSTNSSNKTSSSIKVGNCTNSTGDGPTTSAAEGNSSKKSKSASLASVIGNSSSNSNLSATRSDEKSNNHSAFNTLTQRLSNFSFNSEKSSRKKHSMKNHLLNISVDQKNGQCDGNSASSTLRNKSNGSIVTYDAMKLIGTPACPRFDECPVLEPLSCKKIAHERLTALIFREDCFLTACQDGFVYTWARPVS